MGRMHNSDKLQVTVKVQELIDHLERNKQQHIEDYDKACIAYFAALRSKLSTLGMDATANIFRPDAYVLGLDVPQDRTKKYDKYIKMLKMGIEQEPTMTIDLYQYECFVEDEWDWISSAKRINSSYLGG